MNGTPLARLAWKEKFLHSARGAFLILFFSPKLAWDAFTFQCTHNGTYSNSWRLVIFSCSPNVKLLWTKTNCSPLLPDSFFAARLSWVGAETEFWQHNPLLVSSAAIIKSRRVPDALALNGFWRRSDGVATQTVCAGNLAQKWGVNYDFGAKWNAFETSSVNYSSLRFRGDNHILHALQNV